LFIEERRLLAIFVIFVLCALKGQGEMAAAHLCLNRKLVYGEIIRKIGFQAFNFAADDGRHSRSTVRATYTVSPRFQTRLPLFSRITHFVFPAAATSGLLKGWCFFQSRLFIFSSFAWMACKSDRQPS
jgi:hypothetical protein